MASREVGPNKQQELINNYRLKFHLRALYICGLLPPESISSNPWKSRLYDVYTCLTLIWFVPTITAMCTELLNHLDSLEKAIPVIYQVSAFVLSAILGMYFVYKRKVLMKLFYTLETNFRPYMERLSSSTKQSRTMEGSLHVGKMITNVFMSVGWMTIITWAIIPCAKGYIEFVLQINQDDIEENRRKYFGLAMWFPPKVNRSPMYEITQILHGFSVFTGAMCISGCYMSMLALMYHTASHFSMLVDLIEELDVILSASSQSGPQCIRKRREGEDIGQKLRSADAGNEGSQRLAVDRDMQLHQHLVLCVKYHQQIIDFCYQMNTFLSPVLMLIFFFTEALMCLSTFRLAYGSADDESLRFFLSGSSFSLWLLTFCWAGEYLTEKSLAVERAVYSCAWYQHLQAMRDIQFVIMRAQKPVRLTAGKFYTVSLETYLQIANTVYAYYTLLKNFADS